MCSVRGSWPSASLGELETLYAEGRITFTTLIIFSRMLLKCELSKMSRPLKLNQLKFQKDTDDSGQLLLNHGRPLLIDDPARGETAPIHHES